MEKIFCIVRAPEIVKGNPKMLYQLMEEISGKFEPVSNAGGVENKSDDLEILIKSILMIAKNISGSDGISIIDGLPKNLDLNKYSSLNAIERFFIREKLGISPG